MIVGGSRIAYYLTKIVSGMGMHVKIIESDLDRCTFLSEALPGADIIHGNGTNQRLLLEEGLCQADAFVALTGFDEENIILAMYANTKNVNKIVTKINQLSFSELLYSHGVDSIVSPKLITADHIVGYVRALQNSMGSNVVETMYKLVGGEVEALEFKINNSNPHLGIPLKNVELKKDVLIASIVRAGNIIIPDGNSTVEKDDSVIVVAKSSRLNDLNDIFK